MKHWVGTTPETSTLMSGLRDFLAANGIAVKSSGGTSGVAIGVDIAGMAASAVDAIYAPGAAATATKGLVGFGAGVAAVATTQIGVWLSLGSGYLAARDAHKNERTASGFSQGFVAGLLGWDARQTADHLDAKKVIRVNAADGQMDVIGAKAFNSGVATGFGLSAVPKADEKKAYLREIKSLSSAHVPKHWAGDENKQARVFYVIDLAVALRKYFIQ